MDDSNRRYKGEPLFEGWQIDEMIGKGSFGTVYRVSKEVLGTRYESAVKIIRVPTEEQYSQAKNSLHLDAPSLNRYFYDMANTITEEVNILHSLSGKSNILTYHDHKVIEHEDHAGWDILIRMEYSTPLNKHLVKGRLSREQAVRLGIDMASALSVCKGHGILHRDIKEENIFIDKDGTFKLGDFGVARHLGIGVGAGSMRGTPLYMAPEMFRGEKYDAKIDIYSLGLVLYKLTNYLRMPFWPEYPETITVRDLDKAQDKRLVGETLPPPGYAGTAFGAVILKACAFKPQDRYGSAEEMRLALEEVLKSLSTKEREENLIPQPAGERALVDENEDDIRKRQGGTESIWSNTNSGGDPGKQPIAQEPPPTEDVRSVPKPEQPAPSDKSEVLPQEQEKHPSEGTVSLWSGPGPVPVPPAKKPSSPPKQHWPKDDEDKDSGSSDTQKDPKSIWTVAAVIFAVLLFVFAGPSIAKWIEREDVPASVAVIEPLISKQEYTAEAIATANPRDFTYTLDEDQNAVITGYTGSGGAVSVPGELNGHRVAAIGESAFKDQPSLSEVILPAWLKSIDNWAFSGCKNLISATLPEGVLNIGAGAFYECTRLISINFPKGLQSIQSTAFRNCDNLVSVTFLEGLELIGYEAFSYCDQLASVELSSTIAELDAGAFSGCPLLQRFDVSDNNRVYMQKEGVLYHRESNELVAYPSGKKDVNFSIPKETSTIGSMAFAVNQNLQSVVLPKGLRSINANAFYGCENLNSATLSEGLMDIQYGAFKGCKRLFNVNFPNGIISIGSNAFSWCESLTSVTFSEGLNSIGDSAFAFCDKLTSVTFPSTLTEIDGSSFAYCPALQWFSISESNPVYVQKEGVLYYQQSKELVAYPSGKKNVSFSPPHGTSSIGDSAFASQQYLQSIIVPEGLHTIGDEAFSDCNSLTSIEFAKGLQRIGKEAFYFCRELSAINLPEGLVAIGESAFIGCKSLESVSLPASVALIEARAFSYSSPTLTVKQNSYAATWAKENNMRYVYR